MKNEERSRGCRNVAEKVDNRVIFLLSNEFFVKSLTFHTSVDFTKKYTKSFLDGSLDGCNQSETKKRP